MPVASHWKKHILLRKKDEVMTKALRTQRRGPFVPGIWMGGAEANLMPGGACQRFECHQPKAANARADDWVCPSHASCESEGSFGDFDCRLVQDFMGRPPKSICAAGIGGLRSVGLQEGLTASAWRRIKSLIAMNAKVEFQQSGDTEVQRRSPGGVRP